MKLNKILKFAVLVLIVTSYFMSISSVNAFGINDDDEIMEVINNYYSESYNSYLTFSLSDFSDILDMSTIQSRNKITLLKEIMEKWKYSLQNGLCVEVRDRYPIDIEFIKIDVIGVNATASINISGNYSEAYPPFVIFGKNKFTLTLINDKWLISNHEHSDISQLENENGVLHEEKTNDQIHEELNYEYDSTRDPSQEISTVLDSDPYYDYVFTSSRAVAYANNFVINRNTYFYDASGNDCTNFISQCVAYGFGDSDSYTSSTSYLMLLGTWSKSNNHNMDEFTRRWSNAN